VKLIRLNETIPDAEARHRAAEERILTRAEKMSEVASEKLIAEIANGQDLVKTYNAATNRVAVTLLESRPGHGR
jgi:hypothetical protein